MRKVSAVSATIADSVPLIPATENRIRPSDAATSTMQMAMKIVEMRIMLRARLPQSAMTLALMLIRAARVLWAPPEPRLHAFRPRRRYPEARSPRATYHRTSGSDSPRLAPAPGRGPAQQCRHQDQSGANIARVERRPGSCPRPAAPDIRIGCRGMAQVRRSGIPHRLGPVGIDGAGFDGDAQTAGQRGKVPRPPPEPKRSDRGTDRGNRQQQGRDDAEGRKPPMGDFNPAKQRGDTDQAGGEQENGRCSK